MGATMTKQEAIEELKELAGCGDAEIAHDEADKVLCEYLKSIGEHEIVAAFNAVDKWYA